MNNLMTDYSILIFIKNFVGEAFTLQKEKWLKFSLRLHIYNTNYLERNNKIKYIKRESLISLSNSISGSVFEIMHIDKFVELLSIPFLFRNIVANNSYKVLLRKKRTSYRYLHLPKYQISNQIIDNTSIYKESYR